MTNLDVVLAKVRVGESDDYRPCIVVSTEPARFVTLALCSSQLDLYRAGVDFLIRDYDPDFAATGLKRTSYVIDRPFVRVDAKVEEEHTGAWRARWPKSSKSGRGWTDQRGQRNALRR